MITAARLKALFSYDKETGFFTRKIGVRGESIGEVAGTLGGDGYWQISIGPRGARKIYKAHRLAWLYVYSEWPEKQIDHINGNRSDNRWVNLREATQSQNNANAARRSDNTSGFKGVMRGRKKWRAQITVRGKNLEIGTFESPEAAHAAYVDKARSVFGEFARPE